ncbi:four helix bundle protein [bacterium]|nr:four helix bundle protein [bacterium]
MRYRAYIHSIAVIKFLGSLPNEKIFWVLSDQLLRSATSIGANATEAKSSSSRKDFIKYYEIGLKSANESKYWLCLFRDATAVNKDKVVKLLQETEEISKMLAASLLTLKRKREKF